jgi:succinate dehydrogenase (ubiquinone) cytochrome b560 subunit
MYTICTCSLQHSPKSLHHAPHPTPPHTPHAAASPHVTPAAGFTAASYVALTGDLPGALLALKTNYPLLLFPAKFAISFPIIYHFLGGMRHFVWDLSKIGNQAEHNSLLETPTVELSSQILLGSGLALSFITALL